MKEISNEESKNDGDCESSHTPAVFLVERSDLCGSVVCLRQIGQGSLTHRSQALVTGG